MNKTQDDIIAELDFESDGWQSTYLPEQVKIAMSTWAKQECIELINFLQWDERLIEDEGDANTLYELYLQNRNNDTKADT